MSVGRREVVSYGPSAAKCEMHWIGLRGTGMLSEDFVTGRYAAWVTLLFTHAREPF